MSQLDAPPLPLVAAELPELVDRLEEVLEARESARVAEDAWLAVVERPGPGEWGFSPGVLRDAGAALRAAERADVAAVRDGERPTAYAKVVASQPQYAGEARAVSGYAEQLTAAWNDGAPSWVEPGHREALAAEDDQLVERIEALAVEAVAKADAASPPNDNVRLRAAWRELSAMDEAAERWRTVRSLRRWVECPRPVSGRGLAWRPVASATWPTGTDKAGTATVLGAALALRDSTLRRRLEALRPPARQAALR